MQMNPFPEQEPPEKPQSPIVYVGENPAWEYKLFIRDLELDNAPDEEEINPYGADGWELVGLFVHANMLYCYFKRMR